MSARRTVLAALVTLGFGAAGCQLFKRKKAPPPAPDPGATWVPTTPSSPSAHPGPVPTMQGGVVDLGLAAHPSGADPKGAAQHDWTAPQQPANHRVRYALAPNEASGIRADYRSYAARVGFHAVDADRFSWQPPPGCIGDMHCVYAAAEERGHAAVTALAARFEARVKQAKLDALGAANLVVSMVQWIRYEVPASEPFGLLPPALVVSEKRGDCDSKALLAHMLLADLGVDSVLVSSEAHKHTMLGIGLPTSGTTFAWQGRRYAFTEMTAKGSPIGHVNPELLAPSDWRVVSWSAPR